MTLKFFSNSAFSRFFHDFHHISYHISISTVPGLEIERFSEIATLPSLSDRKFGSRTLKFRQYPHETHTDKQKKLQGAATLRDDAIIIFKLVNFCFWPKEFSHFGVGVVPYKAPQTESLRPRTMKICQYQHETHTDKQEKPQGTASLRNDASLIFILVSFCFFKSEISTLVRCITKTLRQEVHVLEHWNFVSTSTRHIQINGKKPQGAAAFSNNAIIIFPPISF